MCAKLDEVERLLSEALARLTDSQREIIALRVHGEMSYREIAAAMDLPSDNTANALFLRARQKLTRVLTEPDVGGR